MSKVSLSDSDILDIAKKLERLEPGYLPEPIFHALTKIIVLPTMEVAPVRINIHGEVEVLLTQRDKNDRYWPGGWHMPGTVLRATDNVGELNSGLERVLRDELFDAVRPVGELTFVGTKFWDIERGRELDQMHYLEVEVVDATKLPGGFFTLTSLPDLTIDCHKIMIPEIIAAFERAKSDE